jgi:hypothetical protein
MRRLACAELPAATPGPPSLSAISDWGWLATIRLSCARKNREPNFPRTTVILAGVGLKLRFRAALLLVPLPLILLHASASRADQKCDEWVGVSLSFKKKAVQDSFDEQSSAGTNVQVDRCLRDSVSRMASEIDSGCRAGGDLAEIWKQSGFGWIVTCTVIADRAAAGTPPSAKLRTEMRAAVQKCLDEKTQPGACRKQLRRQHAAKADGESECRRFQALPRESRLAEVEGRIQERFSATPVVARCMNAEASTILSEVGSLCRRGVEASKAWNQVLGIYTDRCLDRDFGL